MLKIILERVSRDYRYRERFEIFIRGENIGVWVRDFKGYYGEGLVFLEFFMRGLRKVKFKFFFFLGRVIIVRNGEIILMFREFISEIER